MDRNRRTVWRHRWSTIRKFFWSPYWYTFVVEFTFNTIFRISFKGLIDLLTILKVILLSNSCIVNKMCDQYSIDHTQSWHAIIMLAMLPHCWVRSTFANLEIFDQINYDPLLWTDLSKPALQIMVHLSGEPEHDQVENGCNGRSSLLHDGIVCRRILSGLRALAKSKNKKSVKIIFS